MPVKFKTTIIWLIAISVTINFLAILSPILPSNDAYIYTLLSKHMVLTGDWVNLIYAGQDWLDKPHFPFWVTALSFKIFGINAFAYTLPGFIFYLLGAFFTYKLAKYFYNEEVGLLAALIYLTALRMMLSSADVRAEAYLLGQIIPACYFWLRYDQQTKLKYLFLGAFFTALAMMTKGVFVFITIASGFICMWLYNKEWWKLFSVKWLAAFLLSFIFTAPEIIALYLQFDSHPEKIIFGNSNVSGVKFFFWDSQFGRFFNTGPIKKNSGNLLFFVYTFFWAFLPWCLLFIAAVYTQLRKIKTETLANKSKFIYLFSSFAITFILFSATKFQLDYYTNIIFPFAAIISAYFLYQCVQNSQQIYKIYYVQIGLAYVLLALTFGLAIMTSSLTILWVFIFLFLLLLVGIYKTKDSSIAMRAIIYPSIAINMVFIFISTVIFLFNFNFAITYKIAKSVNQLPALPIYDYQVYRARFELHIPLYIKRIAYLGQFEDIKQNFYLLVVQEELPEIQKYFTNVKIVDRFTGLYDTEKFDYQYKSLTKWHDKPVTIYLVQINK